MKLGERIMGKTIEKEKESETRNSKSNIIFEREKVKVGQFG